MKKIAALDFGEARIGLAVSDASQKIALPRTRLQAKKNLEENAASVASSLAELGPLEALIIGLPLFMNGKESPMSQKVRKFGAILEEKFGFRVIFRDERLTSAQGERIMQETSAGRKQREKLLDGIAACIILQNYLDTR